MKHVWSANDVEAGLFVICNSAPKGTKDLSFMRTVTYKVGFQHGTAGDEGRNYSLISVMTDGHVGKKCTLEEMAEKFNTHEHGFRPATRGEIAEMLMSSTQGFPYA